MKQIFNYSLLFIFLISLGLSKLQAQKFKIEEFHEAQLMTNDLIYGFCQDKNLIYYFGTNKGILIYDGQDLSTLQKVNGYTFNKAVKNITYSDFHLIFSYENDIYYFDQGDSIISKIKVQKPITKLETYENQVFYSTDNSIYLITDFKNSKSEEIYVDKSLSINDWIIDESKITVASSKGLQIINRKDYAKESIGSYLNATKILKNSDTSFLILGKMESGKSGIYKYDNINIAKQADLSIKSPVDFYYSNIGNIWIADKNGKIYIYNGFLIEELNLENDYKLFNIYSIKEDKEGNLWVTGDKGLMKIEANGAFNQEIFEGIVTLTSHENEVFFIAKNKLKITSPIFKDKIYNIPKKYNTLDKPGAFFHDNNWYINTSNCLLMLSGSKFSEVKYKDNLTFITKVGDQIYGLDSLGIYKVDNGLGKTDILLKTKVNERVFWHNSNFFHLNSDKKISVLKNDTVLSFPYAGFSEIDINKFHLSGDNLWTFENGNIYVTQHGKESQTFNLENILNSSKVKIYNIFIDKRQNLWASINSEIVRFSISETDNLINLKLSDIFDQRDFIYSNYFEEAVEIGDGTIYFIHNKYLTIFNPLLENSSLVKPGIKLSDVYAYTYDRFKNLEDTITINKNQTSELAYNSSVHIKASAITTIKRNRSQIKYRVLEQNQDWKYAKSDDIISIYDLPTGENTIILKALTAEDIESEEEIEINLLISPPFWQEYWFYVIIIIIILLIGFIIYKSLNNFKDGKTKELHEKLDKELNDLEKRSHLQILKAERLKQLNELITSQKGELEKKNTQIESQKYELSLTNEQIKKQKDLLEETSSKLKASINYAQRIQDALMSTEIEIKEAIDESFVYFQPRDVVSGDFYWFNKVTDELGDELLILAAVDCTGHGVPGAIVSVVGMNLLNTITNLKKISDPGRILFELNEDIITNLRQNETQVNDGMDMSIVTINKRTKEIKFAGAKNPLMYVENGELIRIRGDKFAIGGQQREKDRNYITHTLTPIDKPRMYFLFSDGYQDQFGGEKGFKFLTSNFKDLLLEIHDKPVIDQKEILYDRINDWKGDYHQTDDMLVIGFRF